MGKFKKKETVGKFTKKEEGSVPLDTAVAPESSAAQPSFWDKIGSATDLWIDAEIVNAKVQAEVGPLALRMMGEIQRPYNAFYTGVNNYLQAHNELTSFAGRRSAERNRELQGLLVPKRPQFPLVSLFNGMRDGWNNLEVTHIRDIRNTQILGPEITQRMDTWLGKSKAGRIWIGAENMISDIMADFVIDAAVLSTIKPIRGRMTYVLQGDEIYVKKFWDDMKIPLGASKESTQNIIDETARKFLSKSARSEPLEKSLLRAMTSGDNIPTSLGRGGELILDDLGRPIATRVTPSRAVIRSVDKQIASKQKNIAKWTNNIADVADKNIARYSKKLDDMAQVSAHISVWDQQTSGTLNLSKVFKTTENLQNQLARWQSRKSFLTNLISGANQEIVALGHSKTISDGINYAVATRALRESAFDRYIAAHGVTSKTLLESTKKATRRIPQKEITHAVDQMLDAVTMGRLAVKNRKNLGKGVPWDLLSENEFLKMHDFMDYMSKNPDAFQFRKSVIADVWPIRGRRVRIMPPWYNTWMPTDRWLARSGASKVLDPLKYADYASTTHTLRVMDGWRELLERNWGRKAANNEELQRHIFWAADGQFDKIDDLVKTKTITSQQADKVLEAGRYINNTFDEIADMLEAAGQWPAGLKREKYWIRHTVKKALKESGDDPVIVARLVEPYDRALGKRINISELRKRPEFMDEIIEHADAGLKAGLSHELYKHYWEPAFFESTGMAQMTGNADVINKTRDFIKYGIKGEITPIERRFESAFQVANRVVSKAANLVPGVTYEMQTRATRQLSNSFRRLTYQGALWGRPKPAIRNATQTLLGIPMSSYKDWWWGERSIFTEGGQELANSHAKLLVGRSALSDYDIRSLKGVGAAGHKMFKGADAANIKSNFNAFVHYLVDGNPEYVKTVQKYGKYVKGDIHGSAQTLSKAFHAKELPQIVDAANDMVRVSQYLYTPLGMSPAMYAYGPAGRAATQFSTWYSNMYYSYLPDLLEAGLTGVATDGRVLSVAERTGILKFAANGLALKTAGAAMGFDLTSVTIAGAVPKHVAPAVKFVQGIVESTLGAGQAALGDPAGFKRIGKGIKTAERGLTFARLRPIPHPSILLTRELTDIVKGKKHLLGLVAPLKDKKR